MKNQINSLADLRQAAGITLQDLAYLMGASTGHLRKVENGQCEASVMIVLIYHMLFGACLEDMFTDLYANLHAQLLEQSQKLIANLEKRQSPKSTYRIKYLTKIVNSLNNGDYDYVN